MVSVENAGAEREWLVGKALGWKGAGANQMERLMLPIDGFAGRVCTVAEITEGSSEAGGRCRGSQGGGATGRSPGVSWPRNQCPSFCCRGVRILGRSRVSCRVVVSPKIPAMCDIL